MNERVSQVAATLTRCWVRLYTAGLSDDVKRDRLHELESDLWEQTDSARESHGSSLRLALHIAYRTLAGAPHDVLWRFEEQAKGNVRERSKAHAALTEIAATFAAFYGVFGLMLLLRIGGWEAPGLTVIEAAAWTWASGLVVVVGLWISKHFFWLGVIVSSVGSFPLFLHTRVILFTPLIFVLLATFVGVHLLRHRVSRHTMTRPVT